MLKHIVLTRRKPDVGRDPALETSLVARMAELGAMIPVFRTWQLSANKLKRPVCWHYVLESEVADSAALDEYLFHPLHQCLVADLKPYFEWAAVDYTVG
ncbi:Dabb family protein [Cupriavidus gilardii]|uniref:Dabb family protein n=1 Tax=Cupriavidus gilardii TaxID=82541 RepID=UPI001EE5484A|nr:Dabb family protein [Cupriavidus gilardii]MCG5263096.1 Dabb family protein [Cupriavidus gilardii]MDF9432081.1 Dabb family protein [Cupriavidus gilardii]